MHSRQTVLAGAVVALLAAAAYGVYSTGTEPRQGSTRGASASADSTPILDESALRTAQALVRMPTTADEMPLAQDALRLADQEMDLAFADAVRQAAAHPQPMTAEAKTIEARLEHAEADRRADSALVAQIGAAGRTNGAGADQLNLAKARLELDEDEVDDAREDLIHAGGDPQGHMDAMVAEHEDASRSSDSTRIKVTPASGHGGLVETAQALSLLRTKELRLVQARTSAESAGVSLTRRHHTLDEAVESKAADTSHPSSLLVDARRRVLEQKTRSSAEKRGDNQHRLAGVYAAWIDVVKTQERALIHEALRDVVVILVIVLVWIFVDAMLVRALSALSMERRSLQTLRVVTRVALQIIGVLLIFIAIFGVPSNIGTIVGLAGAGLTVALKDFIVAFVGWLVLMGKNGIRVGDLVEINGVTGEVVELGMFNTVLHETGNWTDAGHPTGRRVTFTNSYAIEGHYFNFSTSGQWLWDEVRIVVPAGKDPYAVVETLQKHVEDATAESAQQAEREWKGMARGPGLGLIATAPGITIKPVVGGVELTLRYITQAAERYQVRSKLYSTAVSVLGEAGAVAAHESTPAAPR
jgi:small-conductance mechanosensitive channel